MGPLSYMRSVVDRNVVMRRISVILNVTTRSANTTRSSKKCYTTVRMALRSRNACVVTHDTSNKSVSLFYFKCMYLASFGACATSRTVPGSIPGGVPGFFSVLFPSDRTTALGSTQPLVKMSTRNIPGG
jgi:hypothetical protein